MDSVTMAGGASIAIWREDLGRCREGVVKHDAVEMRREMVRRIWVGFVMVGCV